MGICQNSDIEKSSDIKLNNTKREKLNQIQKATVIVCDGVKGYTEMDDSVTDEGETAIKALSINGFGMRALNKAKYSKPPLEVITENDKERERDMNSSGIDTNRKFKMNLSDRDSHKHLAVVKAQTPKDLEDNINTKSSNSNNNSINENNDKTYVKLKKQEIDKNKYKANALSDRIRKSSLNRRKLVNEDLNKINEDKLQKWRLLNVYSLFRSKGLESISNEGKLNNFIF